MCLCKQHAYHADVLAYHMCFSCLHIHGEFRVSHRQPHDEVYKKALCNVKLCLQIMCIPQNLYSKIPLPIQ